MIREGMPLESVFAPFLATLSLGILGLIVAVIPAAGSAYRWMHHKIREKGEVDHSGIRTRVADAIRRLPQDAGDATAVTAFYEGLAGLIRNYAGDLAGQRGCAFTPAESRKALIDNGTDAQKAGRFAEFVSLADQICYSPSGIDHGRKLLAEVRKDVLHLLRL